VRSRPRDRRGKNCGHAASAAVRRLPPSYRRSSVINQGAAWLVRAGRGAQRRAGGRRSGAGRRGARPPGTVELLAARRLISDRVARRDRPRARRSRPNAVELLAAHRLSRDRGTRCDRLRHGLRHVRPPLRTGHVLLREADCSRNAEGKTGPCRVVSHATGTKHSPAFGRHLLECVTECPLTRPVRRDPKLFFGLSETWDNHFPQICGQRLECVSAVTPAVFE
jgi:hypothetical protein